MSFLTVFILSLLCTAIIGAFLPLTWRVGRTPRALASFWGFALLVHLGWFALPYLGAFAPIARWLAILWLASMLAALVLLIPFALLTALSNALRFRSMPAYLP